MQSTGIIIIMIEYNVANTQTARAHVTHPPACCGNLDQFYNVTSTIGTFISVELEASLHDPP